jgi:hypothetical protein
MPNRKNRLISKRFRNVHKRYKTPNNSILFFGPDGKEIGGVIKITSHDVSISKFITAYGVIAFAGAMN